MRVAKPLLRTRLYAQIQDRLYSTYQYQTLYTRRLIGIQTPLLHCGPPVGPRTTVRGRVVPPTSVSAVKSNLEQQIEGIRNAMEAEVLNQDRVFNGEWWMPRDADGSASESVQQHAGSLAWGKGGAALTLNSAMTPLRGTIRVGDRQLYPVLHGVTTKSELVSLLDCERYGSPLAIGRGGLRLTEVIRSTRVIVGAHVFSDSRFELLIARIPGLPMWSAVGGVRQTLQEKTDTSPVGMTLEFDGAAEEALDLSSLPGTVGIGFERNFVGNLEVNYSVTTYGILRIRPAEPQTIDWLQERLHQVITLLAIVAGCSMAADLVKVKQPTQDNECELLIDWREPKPCTFTDASEFFMIKPAMRIETRAMLNQWLAIYPTLAMPSQLALSVLYTERVWLHVEFLSLMAALEGFHRGVVGGAYMTSEEFKQIEKQIKQAIPKAVTDSHRAALKSKVHYGYEYSLNKRLDDLTGLLSADLRRHILGTEGSIPRSWVDTRNYYTHWDESTRGSVLDGPEMHYAGVRLKHLLRTLYLHAIGVPHVAIYAALQNQMCGECAYLIQLNITAHRKLHPDSDAGVLMRIQEVGPNLAT